MIPKYEKVIKTYLEAQIPHEFPSLDELNDLDKLVVPTPSSILFPDCP